MITKDFNFEKEFYIIYTKHNIGEFAERMRLEHPEWKNHPRQWYNPRRWQPTARKEHRLELENFLEEHEGLKITKCPEAYGVNVTELMKNTGIELKWEWPPEHKNYLENFSYIVSLAGHTN